MRTRRLIFWMLLTAVFCFSLYRPVYAQSTYTTVTYQISHPSGDTENYIDNPSYLGFGLDFRKAVRDDVAVGINFGWNVFHETTGEPVSIDKGSLTGVVTGHQDRTLNAFPMMVNASYYFGKKGGIRPYVGMNLGGFVFIDTFDIGAFRIEETRGDWGMAPEVGVVIPVQYDMGMVFSLRYNYAFTGESALGKDIHNSFTTLNVGFVFLQ